MSPLVWDLAHVGNYEELWLLRAAAGREPMRPEIDGLYDAFEHPRAERPSLPLLPPAEARSYIGTVRAEVLDSLASVRFDTPDPLTSGGFVYGMVVQHEHMHDETMLATHQLRKGAPALLDPVPGRRAGRRKGPFLRFGNGRDPDRGGAVPNGHVGRPMGVRQRTSRAHRRSSRVLHRRGAGDQRGLYVLHGRRRIRRPAMVASGRMGMAQHRRQTRPRLLEPRGRPVAAAPVRPDRAGPAARARPARVLVRGRRLRPVGRQEAAHRGRMGEGRAAGTRRPGGRAATPGATPTRRDAPTSASGRCARPRPGSHPAGASAYGVRRLLGDVWEWTSSDFTGYPGFRSFPTRSTRRCSSAPSYKVLRGGSWATHPLAVPRAPSATGTTRSGGRSSPVPCARARREAPDVPPSRLPRAADRSCTRSSTRPSTRWRASRTRRA